jgi:basic amino acid/polyamine antiporter, APA family
MRFRNSARYFSAAPWLPSKTQDWQGFSRSLEEDFECGRNIFFSLEFSTVTLVHNGSVRRSLCAKFHKFVIQTPDAETTLETPVRTTTRTVMGPMPGATSKGLVRAIGRWGFAALTVNCIIGSGVFGLPSALAQKAGRASIVGVVLAGGAIGIVMACFAEVGSRFSETGGPYLYAREAFGRFMGIQVAWLVWFVRLTACAANANLFIVYLGEFWPRATQFLPKLIILSVLIGMLAAINLRGVRAGAHLSTAFTIAKLASLGVVGATGAFYLVAAHRIIPAASNSPSGDSWLQAIVLLIFAYGGFEAAVISAGETRDPRRDVPFGLFTALITCTFIYGLIQWVVVGILNDPGHSQRPLADVARIVIGQGGAALIAAGALFSVYGYLSGNILTTPRITYALAERGDFPSWFALVHPQFRTPYFSIFVFAILTWILALVGSFTWNVTLSAGSRLFYYGVVCAALPVLRTKRGKADALQIRGGNLISVLGVLICLGLLTRIDYSKSAIILAAVAVALLNWLLVRNRVRNSAG